MVEATLEAPVVEPKIKVPTDTKPLHNQSIQNVLSEEVVTKIQNALFDKEQTKKTDDESLAKRLEKNIAFGKEIRKYEDEKLLTTEEAIEIVAAHGASTEDQLEKQLLTDPVTGKLNKLAFKAALARELSLLRRTDYVEEAEDLVVGFGDLEGFKGVNDVLGHKVGDDALRIAALLFEGELRTEDVIARLGGDEFGFIFPRAKLKSIKARLETIRDHELPQVVETTLRTMGVDTKGQKVTMSIGFYQPTSDDSVDDVLAKADKVMYEDKRARNPNGSR